MMTPVTPSTPWLPKINAPPRPATGNDNSARSGLFHLLSIAVGEKESLLTIGWVRQLMSE